MSHSNSEKAKKLKAEADADLKKFNSSKDRRDLSVHEYKTIKAELEQQIAQFISDRNKRFRKKTGVNITSIHVDFLVHTNDLETKCTLVSKIEIDTDL
ncbi:hypothetical protein [Acinetobacter radioresistens]|jgi:hypothetical protein|uniref:Uncharacterized protein n=1 Tax=Acinetobacter radioresistens TaxID=40216 RepID=A0A8H2K0R5_ACIRA|nr:hypothetical protein [Acinetobacter radioresistens]MCK4088365.1 hypothetical protein [Acinetobacter radioresistens]TNX85359.1 hypothetical protein FHY67_15000 [Acinetobacter radioresistens]